MLPFLKISHEPGWLAIGQSSRRFDFVHVLRTTGRLPQVLLAESIERGADDATTLTALKKPLRLNHYHLTALLPAGQYQVVLTDAIDGPLDEAREIVRWKLKDQVDFPVDTAAIDLLPIPPLGRSPQVYALLAAETVMAPFIQSFQSAKLELTAIDLPELAQRNLSSLLEEDDRGLAMLIFDESEGLLTFTFGGDLLVARHIEISAEQLLSASQERREQLFERITLDIQRSLDNFDRSYSMVPLSGLVVGTIPGVTGYMDYLRNNLSLPVTTLNLTDIVDLSAVPALLDPQRQFQCLRALGAALREEPAP
jgi:MSHA biogenesis protein MshI